VEVVKSKYGVGSEQLTHLPTGFEKNGVSFGHTETEAVAFCFSI